MRVSASTIVTSRSGCVRQWLEQNRIDRSKDEAMLIVPVPYRAKAKVVQLNGFTEDEIQGLIRVHGGA